MTQPSESPRQRDRRALAEHTRRAPTAHVIEPPYVLHEVVTTCLCPEHPSHNFEVPEKTLALCRMTLRGWRTESCAGASAIRRTTRTEALATAFRDMQEIAPDAALGVLIYGYHDWPDQALTPVNFASLRVTCSNRGWRVIRVPLSAGEAGILFPGEGHKTAAPDWVWHTLLGRIVFADTPFSLTGTPPQE